MGTGGRGHSGQSDEAPTFKDWDQWKGEMSRYFALQSLQDPSTMAMLIIDTAKAMSQEHDLISPNVYRSVLTHIKEKAVEEYTEHEIEKYATQKGIDEERLESWKELVKSDPSGIGRPPEVPAADNNTFLSFRVKLRALMAGGLATTKDDGKEATSYMMYARIGVENLISGQHHHQNFSEQYAGIDPKLPDKATKMFALVASALEGSKRSCSSQARDILGAFVHRNDHDGIHLWVSLVYAHEIASNPRIVKELMIKFALITNVRRSWSSRFYATQLTQLNDQLKGRQAGMEDASLRERIARDLEKRWPNPVATFIRDKDFSDNAWETFLGILDEHEAAETAFKNDPPDWDSILSVATKLLDSNTENSSIQGRHAKVPRARTEERGGEQKLCNHPGHKVFETSGKGHERGQCFYALDSEDVDKVITSATLKDTAKKLRAKWLEHIQGKNAAKRARTKAKRAQRDQQRTSKRSKTADGDDDDETTTGGGSFNIKVNVARLRMPRAMRILVDHGATETDLALLDSGATHSLITEDSAKNVTYFTDPLTVETADKSASQPVRAIGRGDLVLTLANGTEASISGAYVCTGLSENLLSEDELVRKSGMTITRQRGTDGEIKVDIQVNGRHIPVVHIPGSGTYLRTKSAEQLASLHDALPDRG